MIFFFHSLSFLLGAAILISRPGRRETWLRHCLEAWCLHKWHYVIQKVYLCGTSLQHF